MQNHIHIIDSHFSRLPVRQPQNPRERFVKYYQDLYALHNITLSKETFSTGSQYSYKELGNSVLEKYAEQDRLHEIELLFIVTWAHEFDPDYASVGAYFVDKFKLKCKVFDIGDQGSLAFFTCIDFLCKYLQSSQLKKSLILVMEQTTIPRNYSTHAILPLHDAAFALMIGYDIKNFQDPYYYQISSAGVIKHFWIKDFKKTISTLMSDKIPQNKSLKLICKQNSVINQKYQQEQFSMQTIKTKTLPNYPGNFPLFSYLHDLTSARDMSDYVLICDEDAETKDVGYLVLARTKEAQ